MAIGLILEGGGMRGVYTAGVLDFFLDKNIMFQSIYAVSAGSCNACSYVSRQRDRARRVTVNYINDKRYCSFYSLRKTGDLFGAQFCYDEIPNKLDLYDYDAFNQYQGDFYAVITNCETGEAEYYPIKEMHKDIVAVRASSSLPLVSRMVSIDGKLYLDGGIADSIPVEQSIADGNEKNVIIMTRAPEYRKEPTSFPGVFKKKYKKYPKLLEAILHRHTHYNRTLDFIAEEKKKGTAFVIQPKQKPDIGRVEKDTAKLQALYEQGYADAQACYDELLEFLK